jgi:hypothetical protein
MTSIATIIASLQAMQNYYAPINKLSFEILAYILSFCLPESWPLDTRSSTSISFKTFMGYTQVCSKWRAAALETPSLWTVVPCGSRFRTAKVLERSKSALLSVRLDRTTTPFHQAIIEEVLQHISHIRSLDVECFRKHASFVTPLLAKPGPNIEVLTLRYIGAVKGDKGLIFTLLGGAAPRLIELNLLSCTNLLVGFAVPMLRHLSLLGDIHECINVVQLAQALSGMPALETIDLLHMASSGSAKVKANLEASVPATRLPSLKYITAEGNGHYILGILLALDTPALTGVDLLVHALDFKLCQKLIESQPILTILAMYADKVSSVEITQIDSQLVFTVIPDSTLDMRDPSGQPATKLCLKFGYLVQPKRIVSMLVAKAETIPTQALVISVFEDLEMKKNKWLKFSHHAQIKTIQLSGTAFAAGLIDALGSKIKINTNNRQTVVFFLAGLEDLWLTEVNFFTPHGESPKGLLQLLKAHLEIRAKALHHSATLKLHIRDCFGFDEQGKAHLEGAKCVGAIDWDGKSDDDEDEDEDEDDTHDSARWQLSRPSLR